MLLLNTKSRLILLSLFSLVLLALLIWAVLKVRSENQETSRLSGLAEKSVREEVTLESIRALRESSEVEIEAFEKLMLTDSRLVSVIESLESVSRSLSLDTEVVSVAKEGEVAPNEAQKIKIVIESEGSWRSLFSLMKAIESLPQRVMLEEESLTKTGSLWQGRVILSLYSFN